MHVSPGFKEQFPQQAKEIRMLLFVLNVWQSKHRRFLPMKIRRQKRMSFSSFTPSAAGGARQATVLLDEGVEDVVGFATNLLVTMADVQRENEKKEKLKAIVAGLHGELKDVEVQTTSLIKEVEGELDGKNNTKAEEKLGSLCVLKSSLEKKLEKAQGDLNDATSRLAALCSPISSIGKLARIVASVDVAPAVTPPQVSKEVANGQRREEPGFKVWTVSELRQRAVTVRVCKEQRTACAGGRCK